MYKYLFIFLFVVSSPISAWACASCGCTLSSDWEESSQTGLKFDLRYDYIDQNQLRSKGSTISASDASQVLNGGDPQEVEQETKNQYLTLTTEYTLDPNWKLSLQLPSIVRDHSTLGTASDGTSAGTGGGQYTSSTSNLGDIKIFSRYQGISPQHDSGILLGLKLPTGRYNLTGTSTDPSSDTGTAPIDRGLQPGSGSTDVIAGLFHSEALNKNWDYFAEAFYQYAFMIADKYRPGDGFNFNLGYRYRGFEAWVPEVQMNSRFVRHDSGDNADTTSTGGTLIYLSPGLAARLSSQTELYTFLQLPLYQYFNGVQLAPTYTASIGMRWML